MSLSFNGVSDLVQSGAATLGSLMTVMAWIKPTSLGEGSIAFIVAHGTGTGPRSSLGVNNSPTNSFLVRSGRATSTGQWKSAASTVQLGVWQHVAMTLDASSTANDAQLYLNGQPITTTQTQAPSGALFADTQVITLGNGSTGANTFDGLLGEVGLWTRVLSAAEIAAVYALGLHAVPDVFTYVPMDGGRAQNFGAGVYTITGALAAENPPCRPAGRRG